MKAIYLLLVLFVLSMCKTQQSADTTETADTAASQFKDSGCPEGGICTVMVQMNKKLNIMKDDTGALYPSIEDGENSIITYTYARKGPEGTMDGDYSETIQFEIPANVGILKKENTSLQDVKLLFGKQCFCKGDAGFYRVNQGTLNLKKTDVAIMFELQFSLEHPTHQISQISKTVGRTNL